MFFRMAIIHLTGAVVRDVTQNINSQSLSGGGATDSLWHETGQGWCLVTQRPSLKSLLSHVP